MPIPRFRTSLAYDGTDFAGSQLQPDQRTVQGEFERVLGQITGGRVRAIFAGRTDRGVHATGQVVAFAAPSWKASLRDLERALNAGLPDDVLAFDLRLCDDAFHPRFDAAWREYRYWVSPSADSPFLRRYAWTLRARVELDAMSEGARHLLGTHDFASFAGGGEGVPWSERAVRPRGTTRTMIRCGLREVVATMGPGVGPQQVIEFVVVADAFLPRMVRNIVGALLEVGQGRQTPDWVADTLRYRDRRLGSVLAPARGLTLSAVGYGNDPMSDVELAAHVRSGTDKGAE